MKDTNWIEPEKITASYAWRRWAARILDNFVLGSLSLIPFIILLILIAGIIFLMLNVEEKNISCIKNLLNYFSFLFFSFLFCENGIFTKIVICSLVVFIVCLIILCFVYLLLLSNSLVVAASMACIGNTPAKQLFGIKVLHETGRSIAFKEAFKREMIILRKALWLLIPIIGLIIYVIHQYIAYKNLIKNKITAWDKQMHLKVIYRIQPVWVTLASVIILIGLMYTMYSTEIVIKILKNWLPSSGY